MFNRTIPVLHVSSSAAAHEFYCTQLGFALEFATRGDETRPDPCYMGVHRDGASLHVSSFPDDGISGGVVFLLVDDLDGLFRQLLHTSVQIDLCPTDQTWGNREMYVSDPDGNCIRFVQDTTRWRSNSGKTKSHPAGLRIHRVPDCCRHIAHLHRWGGEQRDRSVKSADGGRRVRRLAQFV